MTINTFNSSPQKRYPCSLVASLISLLIVCSIIGIIFLSGFFDGVIKDALEDMSKRLVANKSDMVSHQVEMYLHQPSQATTLLSHIISDENGIDKNHLKHELTHMLQDDFNAKSNISRIGYASSQGDYMALSRVNNSDTMRLIATDSKNQHQLISYQGDNENSPILNVVENYTPLNRDWFIQAQKQSTPFWSAPYMHLSEDNGVTMTYRYPVTNHNGKFLGVIMVDINPAQLSQYLDSVDTSQQSLHIIVSDKQNVIASSDDSQFSSITMPTLSLQNNKVELPQLSESKSLTDLIPGYIWVPQSENIPYTVYQGDEKFWVHTRAITDHNHLLNWHLLTITPAVLPTSLLQKSRNKMSLIIALVIGLGLFICVSILIRFLTPLKAIAQQARLLGQTDWIPQSDKMLFPEIADLEQELMKASETINNALLSQKKVIEEDESTQLPTFIGLLAHTELYKERELAGVVHLSNYATMANTLGKAYAEEFLNNFIKVLRNTLPKGTTLSRVRVDILGVIFPGVYKQSTINELADQLEDLFFNVSRTHDHIFTGNIGLIHQTLTADNLQNALLNSSLALQQARKKGNGYVSVFERWMHDNSMDNLRLHDQLREGIRNQEFHLVMQPIVSLEDTEHCVEAECLIRWQTEEKGFIPPDKFIAIAEQTGLIVPLGRWVIEKACQELATFIIRGAPQNFKLHINIASLQFCQPDFTEHLLDCIKQYNLTHKNICLEITESTMLTNIEKVSDTLHALQSAGISIAIDDFGSGYSSLSYLHNLPFNTLKIDRSFVTNILDDKKNEAVIASVINLARNFDVPLIAEGIETKEMCAKLYQMGCEKVQGYYFGRPLKFSEWHPSNGVFTLELEA
ncbi:EAL domain-containing protein [Vibrio sp. CK2-1]|uniref:bifunctional diguanylate cyclase/phosphodiesterase n=1 Tax=Vibrio sp. CK2-1 TaxID=2912249 RepID=UPI001F4151CF|nr:EAL domain-containing protein [Vibrio sp. CK2-1]MCF7352706.1 EAL domain-containing protein [Vibrio sp. CK2-1]